MGGVWSLLRPWDLEAVESVEAVGQEAVGSGGCGI